MKLILHIVRKDLVRMRGWIVVWLLVLALPIAIAFGVSGDVKLTQAWTNSAKVMVGLLVAQALVAYMIVLLLVQEDAVIGTRQFWTTRPISGLRLMAAKAIAALAIVWGGAAVVGLPWWLWSGFGVVEIGRAMADYALLAVIVLVPAMLLAAATDSLGRAILWSPVVLALGAWSIPLVAGGIVPQQGEAVVARLLLAVSLWLAAAMLMVAGLYFFRRRRWMIGGVAGALVFFWLVQRIVPTEWLGRPEPRELHPERGAALQVTFDEAIIESVWNRRQKPAPVEQLRVRFAASGPVAPELRLAGAGVRQAWQWGDVKFEPVSGLRVLAFTNPVNGYTPPRADPETEAWVAAQQARLRPNVSDVMAERPRMSGLGLQARAMVPVSIGARMMDEEGNYRARVWLMLFRPEVRNEVPLQAGSSRRGEGHRMILQAAVRVPNETTLTVADFLPQSWTESMFTEARGRSWFRERETSGYVVLNPERKEFLRVTRVWGRRSIYVHGVAMGTWSGQVSGDRVLRGETFVERPGWLEKANLAFVVPRTEAVFARDVSVADFKARRELEARAGR